MRPKTEAPEEIPFPCGVLDREEDKIWVNPRASTEAVLCQEGLVIFELLDWRRKSDE